MRTMLSVMKKKKNNIPEDAICIFEHIVQTCYVPNCMSIEGDNKFMEAMGKYLTADQRFRLWEQSGGCRDKGRDKLRKEFLAENEDKPLSERLELFLATPFSYNETILNNDNTITLKHNCGGCAKNVPKDKFAASPSLYFEGCAAGRMSMLEKSLGIKLKIKSVESSPLGVSDENPNVFTFEILES